MYCLVLNIQSIRQQTNNNRLFGVEDEKGEYINITNIKKAKQFIRLELGCRYNTVFPASLENIPHYVLVKRE